MEIIELTKACPEDNLVCSICGNSLFEVEQISEEKVRLTCENCGQCHLLIATSEDESQSKIKFSDENRNKLNFS